MIQGREAHSVAAHVASAGAVSARPAGGHREAVRDEGQGGVRDRVGPGRRPSSGHPTRPARQPARDGGSATTGECDGPPCNRRARGAGTTRHRSAPGRGVAAGLARSTAAPAVSRPRQDRCRAGSCAPPHGAGRRRRRPGSQRPARRRVAPGSPGWCPCRSRRRAGYSPASQQVRACDRVEWRNLRPGVYSAPSATIAAAKNWVESSRPFSRNFRTFPSGKTKTLPPAQRTATTPTFLSPSCPTRSSIRTASS
jgi:hypothetical protein